MIEWNECFLEKAMLHLGFSEKFVNIIMSCLADGLLTSGSICRNGPWVSHLFFADDSVLFCQAKESECQVILDILSIYEKGSDQKINKEKTNIFFSANTHHDI